VFRVNPAPLVKPWKKNSSKTEPNPRTFIAKHCRIWHKEIFSEEDF